LGGKLRRHARGASTSRDVEIPFQLLVVNAPALASVFACLRQSTVEIVVETLIVRRCRQQGAEHRVLGSTQTGKNPRSHLKVAVGNLIDEAVELFTGLDGRSKGTSSSGRSGASIFGDDAQSGAFP
jgi:hypothetical protein